MNLAINAAEAIGSQDGLISIRTGVRTSTNAIPISTPRRRNCGPASYVFLEVRDSGCGMDEATRAKISIPSSPRNSPAGVSGWRPCPASCAATRALLW